MEGGKKKVEEFCFKKKNRDCLKPAFKQKFTVKKIKQKDMEKNEQTINLN